MGQCLSSGPAAGQGQPERDGNSWRSAEGGGEAPAQVAEAVKQVESANSSLLCLRAAPLCMAECSASPALN